MEVPEHVDVLAGKRRQLLDAAAGLAAPETLATARTSDLCTLLWNRRSLRGVVVRGRCDLLERAREGVRVTWS